MPADETTVSSEAEEYLEAIYRLEKKTGFARTMELARQLKVVPGSVTNTIEGLERRGLVIHEAYKGVKLTETGRKLALDVLRRHRLAERLLTEVLRLEWSRVHDAACRLEHAIATDVIKPLEKALGHPKTCPHGNPIPSESGEIVEEESEPLMKLEPREKGIIVKVTDEKAEVLQHLATLGLAPGVRVEVEKKASFRGPITIRAGEASYTLDYKVASIINVKRTDGKIRE
jgi:DtxR family Mn-dependent transcriptional regulator